MDFPHMKDNNFPHINTVDVYNFQNEFQYSRWDNTKVTFKLLNVKWDSSLTNVPYFENDTVRDTWFNNKEGHTQTLESGFNITPENTVKIPVPYNDAYTYNYIMVDMPLQTSANNMIDYEGNANRVNRWYYFITDMRQTAPNTTELYLVCDYWTTFINRVNIPYMVLNRGHAPFSKVSVETYLSDPINNNEYLLADDFDFGRGESVVKNSSYFPISNGAKWVLFAIPIGTSNFQSLVVASGNASVTPPTYSDETDGENVTRWGDDLIVNDYEWNFNNVNEYANADIPAIPLFKNKNNVYNGYNILGVSAAQATDFFNYLASNASYIFNMIEAVFVVGEDMLKLGNAFTWHGFTLRKAEQNTISIPFTLQKAAFEFDAKYADLAKLYTYPYSVVEITDDFGNTSEVRIENISGSANFVKQIEVAFPYVQYRCFFTGINGNGSLQYNWVELNNTTGLKTIWEDDFSKFMFKWEIPTYALHVNASIMETVDNHASINAKRQAAIFEYQTADRYANTTKQNIHDTQNTIEGNTKAAALTDYMNTAKLSETTTTNMENQLDCNEDVAKRQNLQEYDNWEATWKYKSDLKDINAQILYRQTLVDMAMITAGEQATTQGAALGAASSGVSQLVGGALSLGASGGGIGAAANMAGATFGAVNSGISTLIGIGITHDYALNQKTAAGTKCSILTGMGNTSSVDPNAYNGNNRIFKTDKAYTEKMKNISCTARWNEGLISDFTDDGIVQIENECYETNTNNLHEVTINESGDTPQITPVGTIPQNAGRSFDTISNNAENTRRTENNNADQNRDATWQAANANLVLRQLQAQAPYNDARLRKPISIGNNVGNTWPDVWEQRGVRFSIRTQPKSSIAQAGDGMLRYGYTLHRVWDMSEKHFCIMQNFTYWKADDIWITNDDKSADKAVNVLMNAFLNGLTVWNNPDNIGGSSIYNNPIIVENETIGGVELNE